MLQIGKDICHLMTLRCLGISKLLVTKIINMLLICYCYYILIMLLIIILLLHYLLLLLLNCQGIKQVNVLT